MDLSTVKRIQQSNGEFISKITRQNGDVLWKEQELVTYRYKTDRVRDICSDYVPYGEDGVLPEMPQEIVVGQQKWERGQWDNQVRSVTEDLTATLTYGEVVIFRIDYYTAIDRNVFLSSQNVRKGQDGTIPPHESQLVGNDGEMYFYDRLDGDITKVQQNLTAHLVYSKKYTVVFKEYQSTPVTATEISTGYYLPNTDVSYPEPPGIEYFTFGAWNPQEIKSIQKSQEVIAEYKENRLQITDQNTYKYEIDKTFWFDLSAKCNNHEVRTIGEGITALYSENPEGPFTEDKISGDQPGTEKTVYYRVMSENYPTVINSGSLKIINDQIFDVTFKYYDEDDVLKTEIRKVEYGGKPDYPTVPKRKRYLHDGWDTEVETVTSNLTVIEEVSERTYHNIVWSQLSVCSVDITCSLSGNVFREITASCDWEDHERYADRDINDYWYEYDSTGNAVYIGEESLSCLTRDRVVINEEGNDGYGFTVYPHYYRTYYLSVYCISTESNHLSTYYVLSGDSKSSADMDLPKIENWRFDRWDPQDWNPVESDRSISAIYVMNSVDVSFDPCGADTPTGIQHIIYTYGDEYGLCSQFNDLDTKTEKKYNRFLGWFGENSERRVLSNDRIDRTEPYTLSAKWTGVCSGHVYFYGKNSETLTARVSVDNPGYSKTNPVSVLIGNTSKGTISSTKKHVDISITDGGNKTFKIRAKSGYEEWSEEYTLTKNRTTTRVWGEKYSHYLGSDQHGGCEQASLVWSNLLSQCSDDPNSGMPYYYVGQIYQPQGTSTYYCIVGKWESSTTYEWICEKT